VVDTQGHIRHYAGRAKTDCNCQSAECQCFDASEELSTAMLLDNPTAITVTPDNVLHIADMGNLRVHSIFPPLPNPDRTSGGFEVSSQPFTSLIIIYY